MPVDQIIMLLGLGLVSGVLGGMLGIGGSIIMIPALTLLLGPNQHLYQAAAMIVNVAVAIPATLRHMRAHAVRFDVVAKVLPFGIIMILLGVTASDTMDGTVLLRVFGAFLIYVIIVNLRKIVRTGARSEERETATPRITWGRCGMVGSIVGFMAGLLGVGGGVITVPLLQRVVRLPLRQCIACSSAVMCVTALVGAIRKNMTLTQHVDLQSANGAFHDPTAGFLIAIMLAPTAVLGGFVGASMTHRLPLRRIRLAFILLLVVVAFRMLRG